MSAIIVIEIVVGIVVLAAAVRFAVRDARQRSGAAESEVEPVEAGKVPARGSAPEAEQETGQEANQEAEPVGSTETN
jgi:hypothetical protein